MSHPINHLFFQELDSDLESIYKVFLKSRMLEDTTDLRSVSDARIILGYLKEIHLFLSDFFATHENLIELFDRDYHSYKKLKDRETILETCFLEEFLFPEKTIFPITENNKLSLPLLNSAKEELHSWIITKKAWHDETQVYLKKELTSQVKSSDLLCRCVLCLGDFRAQLREVILKEQKELIENTVKVVLEKWEELSSGQVSDQIFELKKKLDKILYGVRYRLKRSSLNKLEGQVKRIFKENFAPHSVLGQKQLNRLTPFFERYLSAEGLRLDIVTSEEYARFFNQLDTGIWKPESVLQKDFIKLVKSILAFKRKDISGNILREYLGQFWVHSSARRMKRHIIYHQGPTNSGKTHHAVEALCAKETGCYLAPLRLLAGELFDRMNARGTRTTLLTGEEVLETPEATHISSTIEMAKLHQEFECAVIDEIQMIRDPQRGWAWTRALVSLCAKEIHICGDHTVMDLVSQILKLTGDTLEIRKYERMTPLHVMHHPVPMGQLEKGDAVIVFSRRNALKYKSDLEELGFKVSIIYGRLGPEVRREQARKFDEGETDIMVSTDAIAMGLNLPIKRIVFSALIKNIDSKEYKLTVSEIKQIAGRAGRFGRYDIGTVTCLNRVDQGIEILKESLAEHLEQSEFAMVGPDLEIFKQVNSALTENALPVLKLSEFLRLFNTMIFTKPFYCVDLREMIEVTEMVEMADENTQILSGEESFGFACAPVNLGLIEHVQYFTWMVNRYVSAQPIYNEEIDADSEDIDYLETAIKCVELYQWLARHFQGKNFFFDEEKLLENKGFAIDKLNKLLSARIVKNCSSCAKPLPYSSRFHICEECFSHRKFARPRPRPALESRDQKKRPQKGWKRR